ncbi:MAG: hypothetical protein IJF43_05355 [Firmicutes bacterium]|nr:hypothetical protein [Bacillota bacterium]
MAEIPGKNNFLSKPFDLNRDGKLNPAEVALIMMVVDDVNTETEIHANSIKRNVINIDDLNIKGI